MRDGFTLLEVVVAMTIVGLGVVTLLEIFSQGLRLGVRSSSRTETISASRRAMDEMWIRRDLREGTDQGSLDETHRWRLRVRRTEEGSASLASEWQLKEVALEILPAGREKDKTVGLQTLRLVRSKGP